MSSAVPTNNSAASSSALQAAHQVQANGTSQLPAQLTQDRARELANLGHFFYSTYAKIMSTAPNFNGAFTNPPAPPSFRR